MLPKIAFEFLILENDKDSYIKKLKNLDFFEKELSPFFALRSNIDSIKFFLSEKLDYQLELNTSIKISEAFNDLIKKPSIELISVDFNSASNAIFIYFFSFLYSVRSSISEIVIESYKIFVKKIIQNHEFFIKNYNEVEKNIIHLMLELSLMNKFYSIENLFSEALISFIAKNDIASSIISSDSKIDTVGYFKKLEYIHFEISYRNFNEYFISEFSDAIIKVRKKFLDQLTKTLKNFSRDNFLKNDFLDINETNLLKQIFILALSNNGNAQNFLKNIINIFNDRYENNFLTIVENRFDFSKLNFYDFLDWMRHLKYYVNIKKITKVKQKSQRK